MIKYGQQNITSNDIEAVLGVLKSSHLTQGPVIPLFEEELVNSVGANFGVATNSATSALHIACMALGLEKGDILWTVPNSFVASANCGLYCGAIVDFVDIDPNTWNICIIKLQEKLEKASSLGKLPKIIVSVHFGGNPANQEDLYDLVRPFGIKIVEDASHALGASHKGQKMGNCHWSDITIFSFHPVKIITTGEGGMALTKSRVLYERMQLLRSHGITKDNSKYENRDFRPWIYEQKMLGFNYRMTDLEAALGLSQVTRLNQFISLRNQIAERYNSEFKGLPFQTPQVSAQSVSSFHLYVVCLDSDLTQIKGLNPRDKLYEEMIEAQIGVNVHYIPIHLQPYFRRLGFRPGDFPISESYGERALTLPLHPSLSDTEQAYIIEKVRDFFR